MFGWSLFDRNLYKIVFYKQTMDKARQLCTDLSAKMVQVDSLEENQFLYTMLQSNEDIYPASEYWVGNSLATTAVTDWAGNEPGVGDCIMLGRESAGWKWKSAECGTDEAKYFICEKEVTTESSKLWGVENI